MLQRQVINWLPALAVMAAGMCSAAPRVGPLEVRAGHASPACFTVPEAEERRAGAPDFDAITVADVATPKLPVWTMSMPSERTFAVSFRMCIPYAGRLPVLPPTNATALVPGRVYEVAIAARAPQAGMPRLYKARFCLRSRDRGLIQLPAGAPACIG